MTHTLRVLLAVAVFAVATTAHANQVDNVAALVRPDKDCNQAQIVTESIQVRKCSRSEMTTPLVGNSSGYYGALVLDVNGNTVVQPGKDLFKGLKALFGLADKTSATITLTVRKGKQLVFEHPIAAFELTSGGRDEARARFVAPEGSDLTPYFVLSDQDEYQVSLQVVRVRKLGATDAPAFAAVNPVKDLGGPGWLLTSLAAEPYLAKVAEASLAAAGALGESYDLGLETNLKPSGLGPKRVTFEISIGKDKAVTSLATVSVYLRTRPSLLTKLMLTGDQAHVPNMRGDAGLDSNWANLVKIAPNQSLAAYLDGKGIPAHLAMTELGVADTTSAVTRVNAACQKLKDALASPALLLSDPDRQLVLYSELKRRNVFASYDPEDLDCLSDVRDVWRDRYALVIPSKTTARNLTHAARQQQLQRLFGYWRQADAVQRRQQAAAHFAPTVTVSAPAGAVLPSPDFLVIDDSGLAQWDVTPEDLGALQQECFVVRASVPGSPRRDGFARFHGDETIYALAYDFSVDVDDRSGRPRVRSVTLRTADAGEYSGIGRTCLQNNVATR